VLPAYYACGLLEKDFPMRRSVLFLAALAFATPISTPLMTAAHAEEKITDAQALAVVLADSRRDGDRARDQYRHPAETLDFFKVKPGMTVVDYMPSGGWWTRVLVPYLGANGRYIGLNPDVRTVADPRMQTMFGDLAGKLPALTNGLPGVPADATNGYNTDTLPKDLNGKVDRVMIFREMHNLWRMNLLRNELFAIRALLKNDGLLCIEQHRARNNASADYTNGSNGYLRERDVIALVEAHGFEFKGKSNINQNKRDPANHEQGVWMLPPNLRGVSGDSQRARMIEIGESDRMTLVFKKRK
jgi:predicted methyltransferase